MAHVAKIFHHSAITNILSLQTFEIPLLLLSLLPRPPTRPVTTPPKRQRPKT